MSKVFRRLFDHSKLFRLFGFRVIPTFQSYFEDEVSIAIACVRQESVLFSNTFFRTKVKLRRAKLSNQHHADESAIPLRFLLQAGVAFSDASSPAYIKRKPLPLV